MSMPCLRALWSVPYAARPIRWGPEGASAHPMALFCPWRALRTAQARFARGAATSSLRPRPPAGRRPSRRGRRRPCRDGPSDAMRRRLRRGLSRATRRTAPRSKARFGPHPCVRIASVIATAISGTAQSGLAPSWVKHNARCGCRQLARGYIVVLSCVVVSGISVCSHCLRAYVHLCARAHARARARARACVCVCVCSSICV